MLFYLNMISGMCILRGEDTIKTNIDLFLLIVNVNGGLMSHMF